MQTEDFLAARSISLKPPKSLINHAWKLGALGLADAAHREKQKSFDMDVETRTSAPTSG